MLCGEISHEHWTRFQLYADRVRVIAHPPPYWKVRIHPSVWPFLAQKCRGNPLLPRLRVLIACDLFVSATSALTLFFSPTLRTIDLSTDNCTEAESEDNFELQFIPPMASLILQTLPSIAADLEELTFDAELIPTHEHFQSFNHFTKLSTLAINHNALLCEHVLQTLSTKTMLRKLSCCIDFSDSSSSTSALETQYAFPELTELNVSGELDHLVAFIRACQFSRLASLHLQITSPTRSGRPVESFASIFQCCDPAQLTSFSVIFSSDLARAPHLVRFMDYFEPLLAFPNISTFHVFVKSTRPPVHDDDDLARIGAAWPRLADLSILYDLTYPSTIGQRTQGGVAVARPTVSGVVELARRCPKLAILQICELDVSTALKEDAVVLCLGHGLRSMAVRNVLQPCAPQKYLETATLLDRVFPAIDLEDTQQHWMGFGKGWEEILDSVKTIRLRRETGEVCPELSSASTAQWIVFGSDAMP